MELDRTYRAAGLLAMAPVTIRYEDPSCHQADCDFKFRWIAFCPGTSDDALVRSWWEGEGFAGRCPNCGRWILFQTKGMTALATEPSADMPKLPDDWAERAKIA